MTRRLGEREIETINRGHCPKCNHRGFVAGPNAGINWNVECGNVKCRARFNIAWYAGQAQAGEWIEKRSEGGPVWPSEPMEHH